MWKHFIERSIKTKLVENNILLYVSNIKPHVIKIQAINKCNRIWIGDYFYLSGYIDINTNYIMFDYYYLMTHIYRTQAFYFLGITEASRKNLWPTVIYAKTL